MNKLSKLKFVVLGGCAILILYYALLLHYVNLVNPESFVTCPPGYSFNEEAPEYINNLCMQGARESEWTDTISKCKWIAYSGMGLGFLILFFNMWKNKRYWSDKAKQLDDIVNK